MSIEFFKNNKILLYRIIALRPLLSETQFFSLRRQIFSDYYIGANIIPFLLLFFKRFIILFSFSN